MHGSVLWLLVIPWHFLACSILSPIYFIGAPDLDYEATSAA